MNSTLLPKAEDATLLNVTLSMKTIPLTQGKVAVVDDEDYSKLSKENWCFVKSHNPGSSGYARRTSYKPKRKNILMHREIMGEKFGYEIDHINGDGLDNRKDNLRLVTHSENLRNAKLFINKTSKYRGVSMKKNKNRWRAQITANYERIHIGYFDTEEEASEAYRKKRNEIFPNSISRS